MEPERSLPYSQAPATCPCPERSSTEHFDQLPSNIRGLIEKFQDWMFYSVSYGSTGPTIFLFFKLASFTLNTFFTAFYKRFKHTK